MGAALTATPPAPATDALAGKKPDPHATNPLAAYDKQLAGMRSQEAEIDKTELDTRKQLEQRREDLKPPQLQPVPPPQARTTDPQKQWGSAAMALAVLGSLLTRQPLTTAMNSAAAAIKAFHQGDQEAFQTAFKSWQVANENATKLYEFQEKSYEAILGHLDREENLAREEASDKRREVQGQMTAFAASIRDDIMLKALDERGVHGAEELQIQRGRLAVQQQQAAQKMTEFAEYQASLKQLEATPEYQKAGPLERAALRHSLSKGTVPWMYKEVDADLKKKAKAVNDTITAARKQITDKMAAYKAAHNGMIPPDDPEWRTLTRDLEQTDTAATKAKESFSKFGVHVGEDGGGGGDGGSPKGHEKYGSAAQVAEAYKKHEITRDQAAKILRDNGWGQ